MFKEGQENFDQASEVKISTEKKIKPSTMNKLVRSAVLGLALMGGMNQEEASAAQPENKPVASAAENGQETHEHRFSRVKKGLAKNCDTSRSVY